MSPFKTSLAAIALAGALALGGAARAQDADSVRIATQVAHQMFTAMDFADLIRQGAMANTGALDAFAKFRPEWKALIIQAMDEAVAKDTPQMEAMFGAHLAKSMSKDELSAALVVFRDPQARAAIGAYAHHQTPQGDAAKPCAAECLRAMASPAGRSFMTKLQTAFGADMQADMVAAIVPDMFILFGQKAKAAEAKRNP
jgi:hypothetical protein